MLINVNTSFIIYLKQIRGHIICVHSTQDLVKYYNIIIPILYLFCVLQNFLYNDKNGGRTISLEN